jgi:hypothetical protein
MRKIMNSPYPTLFFKNSFLAAMCAVLILPANAVFGGEILRVDWADSGWGGSPTYTKNPDQRILITNRGQQGLQVLDDKTQPPSPFENKAAALLVESTPTDEFLFRLCFRPLEAEEVQSGVAELNIRPVDAAVAIRAGSQPTPWNPAAPESYDLASGQGSFTISLKPGAEATLQGLQVETDSIDLIASDTNYRLTIKWNLTPEFNEVRIFLNGEAVRPRGSKTPLNVSLSKKGGKSLNAFRISLGGPEEKHGKLYIGPLAVASGANPVMDQADDPLLPK